MAVLAQLQYPGVAAENYDLMIGQVEPPLLAAPGFIAHIAVNRGDGFQVTEVWESDEAVQAYVRNVIAPMMENAGGTAPGVTSIPIHHLIINRPA